MTFCGFGHEHLVKTKLYSIFVTRAWIRHSIYFENFTISQLEQEVQYSFLNLSKNKNKNLEIVEKQIFHLLIKNCRFIILFIEAFWN
jgi:hypothetical protein